MASLTADDLALSAEALAFRLLELLPPKPIRASSWIHEILPPLPSTPGVATQRTLTQSDSGAQEIAEALGHLEAAGLVVQWPPHDPRDQASGQRDTFTLTRLGRQAREERTGGMELFAGAFGAIRNVVAHTEVEWSDAVEAAEYVLLGDLVMRILDRVERERRRSRSA